MLCFPLFSQDSPSPNWTISAGFGLQEHDKRLFGYPDRKLLLDMHPERFGTYQFGVNLNRRLINKNWASLSIGIGPGMEISTFTRPFDHLYPGRRGPYIILWTNRYYQNLVQVPIKSRFSIVKGLGLSLEVLPQFNFLTIALHTDRTSLKKFSWWRFDFYSIEVNPGLALNISKFEVGLKYRAFQFKKIDRILFYRTIKDTRTGQTFETYNPFKVWLSIGYNF